VPGLTLDLTINLATILALITTTGGGVFALGKFAERLIVALSRIEKFADTLDKLAIRVVTLEVARTEDEREKQKQNA
jgi:hypothetical protein